MLSSQLLKRRCGREGPAELSPGMWKIGQQSVLQLEIRFFYTSPFGCPLAFVWLPCLSVPVGFTGMCCSRQADLMWCPFPAYPKTGREYHPLAEELLHAPVLPPDSGRQQSNIHRVSENRKKPLNKSEEVTICS